MTSKSLSQWALIFAWLDTKSTANTHHLLCFQRSAKAFRYRSISHSFFDFVLCLSQSENVDFFSFQVSVTTPVTAPSQCPSSVGKPPGRPVYAKLTGEGGEGPTDASLDEGRGDGASLGSPQRARAGELHTKWELKAGTSHRVASCDDDFLT